MVALNSLLKKICILFVVGGMACYPIYTSFYKANAVEHYERHLQHTKGNSMFFNPWQYRVLCPLIIEGLYWTADHTLFKIVEIKGIYLSLPGATSDKNAVTQKMVEYLKNPEYVKYLFIFVGFRFLQNIGILLLCYYYYNHFSRTNNLLNYTGIMLAFLFMGNGVVDADLTFNTYMDATLYLAAGLVIIKSSNPAWIVALTILGALNRETSLLIPALYFFAKFKWDSWPSVPNLFKSNSTVIAITATSTLLFMIIFIGIRYYYGLQPVSSWRVEPGWPMLKLNLFSAVSAKTYMELFGIFGFLPFLSFFGIKSLSPTLKIFLLTMVPAWFGIHFLTAIAYQTRLFLVPTLLIFIPALLELISQSFKPSEAMINNKSDVI